MIIFKNLSQEEPFARFKHNYNAAIKSNQNNIQAIAISTYDKSHDFVDSRFVNLKFIDKDNFIFFTNYESPKADAIKSHNQISALIYWPKINIQIRMKAIINRTSIAVNRKYFNDRERKKNALAISSNQSKIISSYDEVKSKFNMALNYSDLERCPAYWGGYKFKPYEIEFWHGNDSRLNRRDLYVKKIDQWRHYILEP
jgi:pyridoxamine 5'-phosphate oxidase